MQPTNGLERVITRKTIARTKAKLLTSPATAPKVVKAPDGDSRVVGILQPPLEGAQASKPLPCGSWFSRCCDGVTNIVLGSSLKLLRDRKGDGEESKRKRSVSVVKG